MKKILTEYIKYYDKGNHLYFYDYKIIDDFIELYYKMDNMIIIEYLTQLDLKLFKRKKFFKDL